jgi:hypothetical protein
MKTVRLRASRSLLEEMLCLGDRTIVGVSMEPRPGGTAINDVVVFVVNAPDAPDGTTDMEPIFQRADDGTVTMVDPGWS